MANRGWSCSARCRPRGRLRSQTRVTEVVDKGAGKGAVIYQETTMADDATRRAGRPALEQHLRPGGWRLRRLLHDVAQTTDAVPDRTPDVVCELPTFRNAALLYRLSGDLNPLHSDPATARRAGFDRPILHGLCSYGVTAHAVLRSFADYRPDRLRAFDVRFSSPVFPGESIAVEMWQDGEVVSFRAFVRARGVKVIDNGRAVIAA